MLNDVEMDRLVFHTMKAINDLDITDRYYEFKRAVIEDEAYSIISHEQIVDEQRRQCMNQAVFERDHDRAISKVKNT